MTTYHLQLPSDEGNPVGTIPQLDPVIFGFRYDAEKGGYLVFVDIDNASTLRPFKKIELKGYATMNWNNTDSKADPPGSHTRTKNWSAWVDLKNKLSSDPRFFQLPADLYPSFYLEITSVKFYN